MRFLITCIFILLSVLISAAADDPEADTIHLSELTIHGQYYERFKAGSEIQPIDSISRYYFRTMNLNDLIKAKAPVHFKNYGNGMLSSISFRGTGAGHTAVLWNGLQVNQPTLGQSDFSLFPVFVFDKINVHYGASSSRYGSDAIGGGILLASEPDWKGNKISGTAGITMGSYGNYSGMTGISLRPLEKLNLKTRVYGKTSENDFEFENITRAGRPLERQQNASIDQYAILQDIYIRTSDLSLVSINSWYNFTDREIQPPMTNPDAHDTQLDKSFRLSTAYKQETAIGFFNTRIGYLWDYMTYNQNSEYITNQYVGQFNYEKSFRSWEAIAGTEYQFFDVTSAGYEKAITEDRISFFAGAIYNGIKNTEFSLNLRQLIVDDFSSPFSPSFGITHRFLASNRISLKVNGQASVNYRIPTLNDRFWDPGGKKDLSPEYSRNLEASADFRYHSGIEADLKLSGYHYWVNDWILWVPGPSYWTPDNVRKVLARGIELKSGIKANIGKSKLHLNGYYSFTQSLIKESGTEGERSLGKQLPYTPVHLGAIDIKWSNRQWSVGAAVEYTGLQYVTTDNESELPAYLLADFNIIRKIRIDHQVLSLEFRIDNLFNKQYQSILYRAMPGRTFQAGINYFIN